MTSKRVHSPFVPTLIIKLFPIFPSEIVIRLAIYEGITQLGYLADAACFNRICLPDAET